MRGAQGRWHQKGKGKGRRGERVRQRGSARIFMAWRRSNLIKVPARQHLECESALATEEGQGEWIRVSLRMRRGQGVWGARYFATLLVG